MVDNTEKFSRRLSLIKTMRPDADEVFFITAANYFDKVCTHLDHLCFKRKITDSKTKKLILDMLTMLFGHCGSVDELAQMLNVLDAYVSEDK